MEPLRNVEAEVAAGYTREDVKPCADGGASPTKPVLPPAASAPGAKVLEPQPPFAGDVAGGGTSIQVGSANSPVAVCPAPSPANSPCGSASLATCIEAQPCGVVGDGDEAAGIATPFISQVPQLASEQATNGGPQCSVGQELLRPELILNEAEAEGVFPMAAIRDLSRGLPGGPRAALPRMPLREFHCRPRAFTLDQPMVIERRKYRPQPVLPATCSRERDVLGIIARLPKLPALACQPVGDPGHERRRKRRDDRDERYAKVDFFDPGAEERWGVVAEEGSPARQEVEESFFDDIVASTDTDGLAAKSPKRLLVFAPRGSFKADTFGGSVRSSRSERRPIHGPRPFPGDPNARTAIVARGDLEMDVHDDLAKGADSCDEAIPEEGPAALANPSPHRMVCGGRLAMKIPDVPAVDPEDMDWGWESTDPFYGEAPCYSKRGLWIDWDSEVYSDGKGGLYASSMGSSPSAPAAAMREFEASPPRTPRLPLCEDHFSAAHVLLSKSIDPFTDDCVELDAAELALAWRRCFPDRERSAAHGIRRYNSEGALQDIRIA